ncbi:plasmid mobilization protein [Alcaligenes sp. GCM10023179]|uniref:plasmid mobilization protein n=1 Tax=Alcaligenes sp. GCM10023179 TaxID=3252633 RepID=UPI00360908CC
MAEPLSELLRLRITPSQRQHLNEAAALAGLSSSEYARQLLTTSQSMQSELASLRHALENLLDQHSPATQMETLMLLRILVQPEQVSQVHKSMLIIGQIPTYYADVTEA